MRQLDLPGLEPSPRYPETPGHRGVDTSIAAAEHIAPHVTPLQHLILAYLVRIAPAGALRDEIIEACDLTTQTACGRLRELELKEPPAVHKGATRPGTSGRQCHEYLITDAGRRLLETS